MLFAYCVVATVAHGADLPVHPAAIRMYRILCWTYPADAWEAWFTLGLIVTGIIGAAVVAYQSILLRKQTSLVREQMELARKEFNIVHRPRLVPKVVLLINPHSENGLRILFILQNVGNLVARIKPDERVLYAQAIDADGTTDWPVLEMIQGDAEPLEVAVGQDRRFIVKVECTDLIRKFFLANRNSALPITDMSFTFRADIAYLDTAGETRHCSFLRHFNFVNGKFDKEEESDFDYVS